MFEKTANHPQIPADGSGEKTSLLEQELLVIAHEPIHGAPHGWGPTEGDETGLAQVLEQ